MNTVLRWGLSSLVGDRHEDNLLTEAVVDVFDSGDKLRKPLLTCYSWAELRWVSGGGCTCPMWGLGCVMHSGAQRCENGMGFGFGNYLFKHFQFIQLEWWLPVLCSFWDPRPKAVFTFKIQLKPAWKLSLCSVYLEKSIARIHAQQMGN